MWNTAAAGRLALLATLALTACANGAQPTPTAGGTEVAVTLQEWAVVPAQDSAPAGPITFVITNDGPEDVHELVIVMTELAPGELPTDENGVVLEDGEGMEVIDEVEDLAVGATEELEVDLDAGSYVLICNIYDEDEGEAHYQMGMRIGFVVTD